MTHFTLLVKVGADRLAAHDGDVHRAIAEMLAPYDESTEDDRFLAFKDMTDEAFKEYDANEQDLDGVSYKSKYKTFDEFCRKCEGYTLDATGRYGYAINPNAKWDWWVIGGRWLGFFPIKQGSRQVLGKPGVFGGEPKRGTSDIVKVSDIDRERVEKEASSRMEKFFDEYTRWLNGEKFDAWEGPRSDAMDMGLVRVEKRSVDAGPDEVVFRWKDVPGIDGDRRTWTDVAIRIDRDAFVSRFACCFNPIVTWAALDKDGWHEPGKMGWLACSDSRPDQYVAFKRAFVERFIDAAADDDVLVCVDCHILRSRGTS